jgi:hypothetical protein
MLNLLSMNCENEIFPVKLFNNYQYFDLRKASLPVDVGMLQGAAHTTLRGRVCINGAPPGRDSREFC